MASAAATALLLPQTTRLPLRYPHAPPFKQRRRNASIQLYNFPPLQSRAKRINTISCAYVSGPPIVSEHEPKVEATRGKAEEESDKLISWGLLWSLLLKHKLRLGVCGASLAACTVCTLSQPIFSGRFFEVLIGARPDPLWRLLSKVAVVYSLEPIFTVIFIVNMNTIWEKVMSTLRAHTFRRVLIQKVEFFDRYKVGELSGLLTTELGSLKDIVGENVSRDRGFRALSEASHSILE